MDWQSFYEVLRSLWVVWFMGVFLAIVAWAMWPSHRARLEENGRIPLRGDR